MSIYLEAIDSVLEEKRAQAIGQFDLFGGANEISANGIATLALEVSDQEWEKALLLAYEREMLGLYVSDHPLLGVEHVLRSATDTTISQILDEGVVHEQIITIAGLITAVQRKVSRQGQSWAIVTVEDLEGAIDVRFFSSTYQTHALNLIEDRIVIIRGKIDKREETPQITALELSLADINQAPIGPFVIKLEAERCTPPVVDRMKEILRSHPGTREVHLKIEGGTKNTILKLDDGLKITASPSLSADLKSILGPDCLV
jgi:DNA polymerase-3 subunit alpha